MVGRGQTGRGYGFGYSGRPMGEEDDVFEILARMVPMGYVCVIVSLS
jgi:hypothetical protein